MKLLAAASASTVAVWVILYEHPMAQPPRTDTQDIALTLVVSLTMLTAAIVMLISRHWWSIRAIGLFFIALSQSALYGSSAYRLLAGYGPDCTAGVIDPMCRSEVHVGIYEAGIDLSRACSYIGAPALAFGLIVWFISRKRNKGDGEFVYDGTNDRRKEVRREVDRDRNGELWKYKEA